MKPEIHIIGSKEKVDFPTLGVEEVAAKIDTGADVSSIWCSKVERTEDGIECVFFSPESSHYTGRKFSFQKGEYKVSRVHNSFGHNQRRYKVKIPVIIGGRRILASFTLADRAKKTYPVLIGRKLIAKKFLVDVAAAQAKITRRLTGLKRAVEQ
jgi:hypothetical protein